jgi:hypothetical protein
VADIHYQPIGPSKLKCSGAASVIVKAFPITALISASDF